MADERERQGSKRKRFQSRGAESLEQTKNAKKKRKSIATKKDHIPQPKIPKSSDELSPNWKALQAMLAKEKKPKEVEVKGKRTEKFKRKFSEINKNTSRVKGTSEVVLRDPGKKEIWFDDVDPDDLEESVETTPSSSGENQSNVLVTGSITRPTKIIALDCEMVGIGPDGKQHMLARVSIVNSHSQVVYDTFVAPQEKVVDYRTPVSGVRPANLKNAPDFKKVQKDVSDIIQGRILVGHALGNDLSVLLLDHPRKNIRDTSKYEPFQEISKKKSPALRFLAKKLLNIKIQDGEHSSVQDAQATMRLYKLYKKQWEKQQQDKKFRHRMKVDPNENR